MNEKNLAASFRALSHPLRLRLLQELAVQKEGIVAGEIAALIGLRQNTLSSHLARLKNAGLVYGDRRGRHIVYILDRTAFETLLRRANQHVFPR